MCVGVMLTKIIWLLLVTWWQLTHSHPEFLFLFISLQYFYPVIWTLSIILNKLWSANTDCVSLTVSSWWNLSILLRWLLLILSESDMKKIWTRPWNLHRNNFKHADRNATIFVTIFATIFASSMLPAHSNNAVLVCLLKEASDDMKIQL